jgi:hypothetical protein
MALAVAVMFGYIAISERVVEQDYEERTGGLQQPLASRCPGAVPGLRRRRPAESRTCAGVKRACCLVCFEVCCWHIGHARAAEPT